MKPFIVFITGPTAIGKTKLSIDIAKKLNTEIISCDSVQVYKKFNIGSAKVNKDEMENIPHHLIDIVDGNTRFTVKDYVDLATIQINKLLLKGKIPIFVGGTGLYIESLINGFNFGEADCDLEYRKYLSDIYDIDNGVTLLKKLEHIDKKSIEKITNFDKKKIIRSLEIYHITGKLPSNVRDSDNTLYNYLIIQLSDDREELYARINKRVDDMLSAGLIEENISLLNEGISYKSQPFQAIGYKQVHEYLRGLLTYDEMARLIKQFSRNYAKRQLTWTKRYENKIILDRSKLKYTQMLEKAILAIQDYEKKYIQKF